jgi:hypothetical protein
MPLEIHTTGPLNPVRAQLANSRLLHFDLSGLEPSDWAANSATVLLQTLRADNEAKALNERRTIVLVSFPPIRDVNAAAHRGATVQSLRGIVQSVTREFAHAMHPVNLVAADGDALDGIVSTIHFLDADNGSYTAGSTIDLTTDEGLFR